MCRPGPRRTRTSRPGGKPEDVLDELVPGQCGRPQVVVETDEARARSDCRRQGRLLGVVKVDPPEIEVPVAYHDHRVSPTRTGIGSVASRGHVRHAELVEVGLDERREVLVPGTRAVHEDERVRPDQAIVVENRSGALGACQDGVHRVREVHPEDLVRLWRRVPYDTDGDRLRRHAGGEIRVPAAAA